MTEKSGIRWMMYHFVMLGLIMLAMGVSDALRGDFIPVFTERYSLSTGAQSAIVGVSYVGSLVFLLAGGALTDRFSRKGVAIGAVALWMCALIWYLFTDSYSAILSGMFVTMGTSVLLCTIVNLMTPYALGSAPGMMINLLFFVQGIGTTFSQKVIGSAADHIRVWKISNGGLLIAGALILVLLWFSRVPEEKKEKKTEKVSFRRVICKKEFWLLVGMFGMYFIAEHGLMNWLITYCIEGLSFTRSQGATCLALFFGTITMGRLAFSPLIKKFGLINGLVYFGFGAAVLYVISFLGGGKTIWMLTGAGVFTSVLYPTMDMTIQNYFPPKIRATASGWIIGVATLFDILFNFGFGSLVDQLGFRGAVLVLPAAMVLCYGCILLLKYIGKEEYKIA